MWRTWFEIDVVSDPGSQANASWSRSAITVRRYANMRWKIVITFEPISASSSFDTRSILNGRGDPKPVLTSTAKYAALAGEKSVSRSSDR